MIQQESQPASHTPEAPLTSSPVHPHWLAQGPGSLTLFTQNLEAVLLTTSPWPP